MTTDRWLIHRRLAEDTDQRLPLIAAAPPAHPPCYAAIEGEPHRTIILARAKKRYLPRAVNIFREELQAFCAK